MDANDGIDDNTSGLDPPPPQQIKNYCQEENSNENEGKKKFKPLVTAFVEKGCEPHVRTGGGSSFAGEHMLDNISLINDSTQQQSISVNYFKNLKENSMRQQSYLKTSDKKNDEQ